MAWHQLSVICDPDTAFALSDFFSELGAVSVTYMDAEEQPVYEPPPGATQIWDHTKVIALFELNTEPDLIKTMIQNKFGQQGLVNWHQEVINDQNWERAWMEHYHPMKFGERLWVCPTGQERHENGCLCMTLDPGLAFGTGTHPTTALCLEWLASNDVQGKQIIDYGCGSGILAVAALLLGAERAYCIDIDTQALEATLSNAKKNQVAERIHCFLPEQFSPEPCDIVLANILANPLVELSESISALVKAGGSLILSGILNEQAETVASAYRRQGMKIAPPVSQEDWCRLDGIKPSQIALTDEK